MEMTKGFFISFECEVSRIKSNGINGRIGIFYSIEDIYILLEKISRFSPCIVEIEVPSSFVKSMPNQKKFYFHNSASVNIKRITKLENINI